MNKLAVLFVFLLILSLGGCASNGNSTSDVHVAIPTASNLTYSINDSAADVAQDVARQFPGLSAFRQYPQTQTTAIGDIHRTGVIATQEGNKVRLIYQHYRMINAGADRSEVVTSTLCELTVLPIQGVPGKFTITSSPLSEKIGHGELFLPLKPVAPIDKIASDVENTMSKLRQSELARDISRQRLEAATGDTIAQLSLGLMYQEGRDVPRDYAQAANWIRKAAEQGYAPAQYNLGFLYDTGRGLPRNYPEAVKWYRQAAEQGNAAAMNNLGSLYGTGDGGLTQDYIQAYTWWILAKSISNPGSETYVNASRNMDNIVNRMAPGQIARAQQEASEWKATHSGGH